jgi:hypothetical protein
MPPEKFGANVESSRGRPDFDSLVLWPATVEIYYRYRSQNEGPASGGFMEPAAGRRQFAFGGLRYPEQYRRGLH